MIKTLSTDDTVRIFSFFDCCRGREAGVGQIRVEANKDENFCPLFRFYSCCLETLTSARKDTSEHPKSDYSKATDVFFSKLLGGNEKKEILLTVLQSYS